jgi:hypothetical protein
MAKRELEKMQFGFRVTPAFHKRMQEEALRRDISLQDMILDALQLYFKTPVEDWDWGVATYIRYGEGVSDSDVELRNRWVDLFVRYLNEMPKKKAEFLVEFMKTDLKQSVGTRRKKAR